MRKAKSQIRQRFNAVWPRPSPSAYRFIACCRIWSYIVIITYDNARLLSNCFTKRSPPETKKEEKMRNKQYPNRHRWTNTYPPKQTEDAAATQFEARLPVLQSKRNHDWVNSSPQTTHAATCLPAKSDSPSEPLKKSAFRNPMTKSQKKKKKKKEKQLRQTIYLFSILWVCSLLSRIILLESIYLHYSWC